MPLALEHLRLDLEPVAEQDHHQRDDREVVDELRARAEVEHLEPAFAEHEAGDDEQRRQRQERPLDEAGDQRAHHQQAAEDEQHGLEAHRARVCQRVHEGEGLNDVRITVLGKSPSWQDVDGACSGYLIEEGNYRLLLDCGNGVFSKLRRFIDYVDVDAVVISHLHADHFLDLVPFSYALTYAPRQQPVPVGGFPGPTTRRARRCTSHPAPPSCSAASSAPGATRI